VNVIGGDPVDVKRRHGTRTHSLGEDSPRRGLSLQGWLAGSSVQSINYCQRPSPHQGSRQLRYCINRANSPRETQVAWQPGTAGLVLVWSLAAAPLFFGHRTSPAGSSQDPSRQSLCCWARPQLQSVLLNTSENNANSQAHTRYTSSSTTTCNQCPDPYKLRDLNF
jgi:hypothetical protein